MTFLWERGDDLYRKRYLNAGKINTTTECPVFVLSKMERLLYSLMSAYSSFFFITDDSIFNCCYFVNPNSNEHEINKKLIAEEEYIVSISGKKRYWIVLDRLGIKTTEKDIIYVYSLFPFDLLHDRDR